MLVTQQALHELGVQTARVQEAKQQAKTELQDLKARLAQALEFIDNANKEDKTTGFIHTTRAKAPYVHLNTMKQVYTSQRATIKKLRSEIEAHQQSATVTEEQIENLVEERDEFEEQLKQLTPRLNQLEMDLADTHAIVTGFVKHATFLFAAIIAGPWFFTAITKLI